ncbi:MAG: multicopper oxidase domain-containing protein [Nitrospirae bacterium]|nr:multicopper oxidase domain-containing protein [Nitrospirota bacterium]MBI5694649.1 multicopper oxidase domain-containing protein [Nitrospirota bacterium]
MLNRLKKKLGLVVAMAVLGVVMAACPASAVIQGVTGTAFNFTAKPGYIYGGDGVSIYIWGFANGTGVVQYPGPTLLLHEGDNVSITLTNSLTTNVSMVFPGMSNVAVTPGGSGVPGIITTECPPAGTVTYTFTAANPGTYYYQSGTDPALQVEMGLFGAIVVYPTGSFPASPGVLSQPGHAYNDTQGDSAYDREYLLIVSEMDARIHRAAERGIAPDTNGFFSVYWFYNGRNMPDTMGAAGDPMLPTQPYNALFQMHPGEKVLYRIVGIGRELHPVHPHGNHTNLIAQDGRLLSSGPANGADLRKRLFTIPTTPGGTYDTIFEWTGANVGWDIYGHAPGDPMQPNEFAADHGKPFPTPIPHQQDLMPGQLYSGSPFLGGSGALPPGEGGFNPTGAYMHMVHDHVEKELCNDGIFPGGAMTIMAIEHPSVPIP